MPLSWPIAPWAPPGQPGTGPSLDPWPSTSFRVRTRAASPCARAAAGQQTAAAGAAGIVGAMLIEPEGVASARRRPGVLHQLNHQAGRHGHQYRKGQRPIGAREKRRHHPREPDLGGLGSDGAERHDRRHERRWDRRAGHLTQGHGGQRYVKDGGRGGRVQRVHGRERRGAGGHDHEHIAGQFLGGVRGVNKGTGDSGIGVYGSQNGSGFGVYGFAPSGDGVVGESSNGAGVRGTAFSGGYGNWLPRATGRSSVSATSVRPARSRPWSRPGTATVT